MVVMITVAETSEFDRQAKALLSEAEKISLIDLLAAQPLVGVSLGGGVRKLRLARAKSGKSGGYRVVYFYRQGTGLPLYLLSVFAKSAKENLSDAELDQMINLGNALTKNYRKRQ